MYIVVTGLKLHSALTAPLFWRRTVPAFTQAQKAPGCLRSETRKVDGVYHTLTAWRDATAARDYMTSGAHGRALAAFHQIGTGHVVRWHADALPTWDSALQRWRDEAPVAQAN